MRSYAHAAEIMRSMVPVSSFPPKGTKVYWNILTIWNLWLKLKADWRKKGAFSPSKK